MRGHPYVFSGFDPGVNLEAAPYSLDAGYAKGALNFRTSPMGAIVKRNGCITLAEVPVLFTSLFGCNLGTDVMIGAGGTKLYTVSTTGIVKTLKSGLTDSSLWEWIQAPASGGQGPIYGVNGTDTPQYWDGTSEETKDWVASEGSVPNGKIIAYHENRVYIAKGSTVYWSDIINPRVWTSPKGGSTEFDPEDGEEITAFGKVGPYLMVFKERKAFLITDSNTGAYRRISDDMGCIAPRSVVATEAGTFFITPDGEIVVTDGQSFEKKVSIPIKPILQSVKGSVRRKACAIHVGDYVYFSVSENGGVNDTVLEFNLISNSWWPHKITYSNFSNEEKTNFGGIGNYGGEGTFGNVGNTTGGINQFAALDPSDTATLYAAGANTIITRILKCFVDEKYTDTDGSLFQSYWESPWHVFTYPHIRKRMREIRVDAKGDFDLFTLRSFSTQAIKEEVKNWEQAEEDDSTDFGVEGDFGGAGKFGGPQAAIIEKRFYTPGDGRAWSLRFESENAQALEIYAYTCAVNYRKD